MTLRLGLAGLGIHGERYARHLLAGEVAGARLAAVSRADGRLGREFADRHGLRFAADPAELSVHPDVDAVVVVLPPTMHAAVASACVENGRPVLVEKPMAADLPAALALRDAVRRHGTPLMVAQTLRFDPLVERLRSEAPSLGALRLVAVNQRFEPAARTWLDRPGPGGILLNTAVHGFDLLRFITGCEPAEISADTSRRVTERTDDQLAAWLRLEPGGVIATFDNVRTTDSRSGRIELVGADGQLWGDHVHRTLVRVRGRSSENLGPVEPRPTVPATLSAFVRALATDRPMPVDVDDGVATIAMVEAAARSVETGRRAAVLLP